MATNEELGDHRAWCGVRNTYLCLRRILTGSLSGLLCYYIAHAE